ncbi:MAG: ADP-glyceromanno-heptose 6-epimerase, partial [Candidatus Omnitrophota bacterium]|nr:ADP-glyceromanno-heptose 6-epimerase [Candidatus Omnitrophota bacterium]
MIIVTGAAGFIGSCLVAKLNERKIKDLILVDHMDSDGAKKKNLAGKQYLRYLEKDEFIQLIEQNKISEKVDCVIHMGACSSTTLDDAQYFDENNYQYTRKLCDWALAHKARFIYASSASTYGDGSIGYKDDLTTILRCRPLNLYGQSKQKFDAWVVNHMLVDQVVGLKFFNVFGPNEYHKGEMRSVVCKAYPAVAQEGKMNLFKSYKKEYADGEQKRDFIYIKDAVDVVMYFFDQPAINGIFNLGTGQAR